MFIRQNLKQTNKDETSLISALNIIKIKFDLNKFPNAKTLKEFISEVLKVGPIFDILLT